MSCITSTWPEQSGPAPVPMVGMESSSVTSRPSLAGIDHLRTGLHQLHRIAVSRLRRRISPEQQVGDEEGIFVVW